MSGPRRLRDLADAYVTIAGECEHNPLHRLAERQALIAEMTKRFGHEMRDKAVAGAMNRLVSRFAAENARAETGNG